MMEQEDLGLNLSLRFPAEKRTTIAINHPMQLNLIPSTIISPSPAPPSAFNNYWNTHSSADGKMETRSFLKGIDVNRMPETAAEEEGGVSSPNASTISSLSGNKRSENEMERTISDEEDGETCRKKLRLTKEQSAILEDTFKHHHTLNPKQKLALSKRLGLRPRQVEVWFQNRRARTKLKQTEVDCEFLKRCVENLTEENRRLQKEVQELRSLKHSPQFYMQMTPPTTLTMCPSCERVASGPTNTPVNVPPHRFGPPHQAMPLNMWGPISQGQYGQMDSYPTLARQN